MHKKLAADLTSLAHSILQMKNKEDVFALKTKAHQIYEKLALLAYVEEYINTTPNTTVTKEALISKIAAIEKETTEQLPEAVVSSSSNINNIEETNLEDLSNPSSETNQTEESIINNDSLSIAPKNKEEIAFDITEVIEEPIVQENIFTEPKKTTSTEEIVNNEITEQPFDELEDILFGEKTNEGEHDNVSTLAEETIEKEPSITEEVKTEPINEIIEEEKQVEPEPTIVKETIIVPITSTKEVMEEEPPIIPETPIVEEIITEPVTEINETVKQEVKTPTLEEELGDTISVDVMANLFEKAPPKTLNDKVFQETIKIDLNDRIAFVNHLFEGNQEDFNRVISQLNTIKTEKEAKQFILKMIKPDYNWSDKEPYEARLLEIIERRFA